MNSILINFLESLLGYGKHFKGGEVYFTCPFCFHYKKKLAVNTLNGHWQCWVCESRGKSLYTLLKKMNCTRTQIDELNNIVGTPTYKSNADDSEIIENIVLPKEFKPLWKRGSSPEYKMAKLFLKRRGLTEHDILRYGIGYCEFGLYGGRIIVPSYDKDGMLNYYTARSFYNDNFKYKNPPFSKDIIGFELFVNWNYPIVIVEGVFDAMAVKRNAIPIFGKRIPKKLETEIIKKGVKNIYISLDVDAKKEALMISKRLIDEGRNVYFVEILDKDPSELGFEKLVNLIDITEPLTFSKLVGLTLQ